MDELTGSAFSQLRLLMKQVGYNKDTNIELGTVVSAPPDIRIKLDNETFELEKDDVILASAYATLGPLVGDRVIVISAEEGQRYFVLDKAVTY